MKTAHVVLSLFVVILLLAGCDLMLIGKDVQFIEPSNTIITEERTVSGFTGIDFSTFGKVVLTQGDTESLTIRGSDNIVPMVKTSVDGGILRIYMEEGINITNMTDENVLIFTITVKDLTSLNLSGAGKVTMDSLSTLNLTIDLSGAGQFVLDQLAAETLDVTVSGVGNVEISGEVATATIELSGAGPVNAQDLQIETANVTLSGIGGATLWVTDQLTGTISGAGSVSYYGDPQVQTTTTGIGIFNALGDK